MGRSPSGEELQLLANKQHRLLAVRAPAVTLKPLHEMIIALNNLLRLNESHRAKQFLDSSQKPK